MDLLPPTAPPLPTTTPNSKKRKRYYSRDEILDEFGPVTSVQFDPFRPESHQDEQAKLPSTFPLNLTPLDYFSLFFTSDLMQTITKNTNRYSTTQRQQDPDIEGRRWKDLLTTANY